MKTYSALLQQAETAEATPRWIFLLQQAISRLMPQTFEETLYYAYGLSVSHGCVDLRPGMILRVAGSGFDLTAVDPSTPWSTGYAPGSVVDLPIGDYLEGAGGDSWRVGRETAANMVLRVQPPESEPEPPQLETVEAGSADAADLLFPAFRNPYYRLLIPGELQIPTPPAVSRPTRQFAIAAAPTWGDIDSCTPGGNLATAYFRGRAVLKPCIRVEVDGGEQVVPVGTTVGNVLDGLGRRPAAKLTLRGMRLERSLGSVVLDPAAPFETGGSQRVHLGWDRLLSWGGGRDALSLPLLHGDRLTLGREA
jgi:hypothetical protein